MNGHINFASANLLRNLTSVLFYERHQEFVSIILIACI